MNVIIATPFIAIAVLLALKLWSTATAPKVGPTTSGQWLHAAVHLARLADEVEPDGTGISRCHRALLERN